MSKIIIEKVENGYVVELTNNGTTLKYAAKNKKEATAIMGDIFLTSVEKINCKKYEFEISSKIIE